jgi:HEAT repeat protein
VAAILLAVLAVASPPPATASPEVRANVSALLNGFDRPVSPGAFAQLGPEAEAALAEIALSNDFAPRRARALEVLSVLKTPRAEEIHRTVAASTDAHWTVRRAAVLGLGRLLPAERAAPELGPFLERDPDPAVRAAAAEALAAHSPAQGCGAVRAQAAREATANAARFRRAVVACERASGASRP